MLLDVGKLNAATPASQNNPLMAMALQDFPTMNCVCTAVLTFHKEPTCRLAQSKPI